MKNRDVGYYVIFFISFDFRYKYLKTFLWILEIKRRLYSYIINIILAHTGVKCVIDVQ